VPTERFGVTSLALFVSFARDQATDTSEEGQMVGSLKMAAADTLLKGRARLPGGG